jgi:hypothetical protein
MPIKEKKSELAAATDTNRGSSTPLRTIRLARTPATASKLVARSRQSTKDAWRGRKRLTHARRSRKDHHQPAGIRKVQRAHEHGISDVEYDRIGANPEGQGEHRGHREAWIASQQAQAETEVLCQGDHKTNGFDEAAPHGVQSEPDGCLGYQAVFWNCGYG